MRPYCHVLVCFFQLFLIVTASSMLLVNVIVLLILESSFSQNFPKPALPENVKAAMHFEVGMSFFKEESWNQSCWNFKESWKAFNQSKMLNLAPPTDGSGEEIQLIDILDFVQYTAFKSGDSLVALSTCKFILNRMHFADEQDRLNFQNLATFYKSKLPRNETAEALKLIVDKANFYEFCSDSKALPVLKKLSTKRRSVCRLNHRNYQPLLVLSPVKEEIISWNPYVVRFHDIISTREISLIQQLSAAKFKRSNVISLADSADPMQQFVEGDYRKAETAWIHDGTHFSNLTRRIEAVTALSANSIDGAEQYQVTKYGITGHNGPHYDVILGAGIKSGDRIATLLLYLSDVEEGGGTLFNKLKIRVDPIQGSGLFWHNCHQNETHDIRTLHSACPIVRGSKMVVNRWFRFRGQFRTRRCRVDANSSFSEHSLSIV